MRIKSSLFFIFIVIIILLSLTYLIARQPFKSYGPEFTNLLATVYKSPTCSCCKEYIGYLKSNGFKVEVKEVSDDELENIKKQAEIPSDLWSCHTVFIKNYFVEGHVPVEAISKLLNEKPRIKGIALPGMPSGSPGMPGIKFYPFKIYAVKDVKNQGLFMEI